MKFLLRIAGGLILLGSSSYTHAMLKSMSNKQIANDSTVGIPALSQALQKINLRAYTNEQNNQNNIIKSGWYDVVMRIEFILNGDSAYKGLMSLFHNMKDLSNELFDAVAKSADFKEKKAAVGRLSKKQGEVKRFLLGQKAKSVFSFGKKQDEYKNMRQLLLGMIDMLNTKIDLIKKSLK